MLRILFVSYRSFIRIFKRKRPCTCWSFEGQRGSSERIEDLSFFCGLNLERVAMGKSPGRWVKTLIFGKRSSISKSSKPNDEKKDREMPVSLDQRTELRIEKNIQPDKSQDDECIAATTEVDALNDPDRIKDEQAAIDSQNNSDKIKEEQTAIDSQNDSDRIREEQAAIDLQAALRGYVACRKLKTLKGVIRSQALIRGHLVRRQAVSTLYCMIQIVKFQALVRGRKTRNSNIGVQVGKICNRLNQKIMPSVGVNTCMQLIKQLTNNFAKKILASSPAPMPLHFEYNPNEPNSVSSWLERWSASKCWHLPQKPTSNKPSKPRKPHTRRSSLPNVETIAYEFDKPIRHVKKISSIEHVNCIEEHPELVLERIKRNLRKVSSSVIQSTNDFVEKMIITEPEKLEDDNVNERKKSKRLVCVPVKQESSENNESSEMKRRSVPGYMAATVSAKAKVRRQEGVEDTNALSRRHSLSSLTNGSVLMAKTSGKFKNDHGSLRLSRDGNVMVKVNQAEWQR